TPGSNTASFTVAALQPPSTPTPVTLTFNVTVTDSTTPTPQTTTVTTSIFVGPDTITATNVVYAQSKSRLQVAASTNALPKGAAELRVTPLGSDGKTPIGPQVVCTYDPNLDTYNVLSDIVNP